MRTRELLIIDVWKPMDKDVVGAAELEFIRKTILERFGHSVSPASIARALADHGVRLGHPEILQADVRWRESNLLLTPEDLTLDTLEAATSLMNKIENLRRQIVDEKTTLERLQQQVRQIKHELEVVAGSDKSEYKAVADELAQWLTIWLQNPQIFAEWLSLRRTTVQFRERFES